MSDSERVRILREALERVRRLCHLPHAGFCTMQTRREDCNTHTTDWAHVHAEATKALRVTE